MGRNEEDFARGLGYKLSSIPMRPNKFHNSCVDCGRKVFAGEGTMVKGEDHVKIKTVCNVCGDNWLSKESLTQPTVMKSVEERHKNWTNGGYNKLSGDNQNG